MTLEDLGPTNVFIGRNNTGKSSIFEALKLVRGLQMNLIPLQNDPLQRVAPVRDRTLRPELTLRFALNEAERHAFLAPLREPLAANGNREDRGTAFDSLLNSPFATLVEFELAAGLPPKGSIHLVRTRILAADGQWSEIDRVENREESVSNPARYLSDLMTIAVNRPSLIAAEIHVASNVPRGLIISDRLASYGLESAYQSRTPRPASAQQLHVGLARYLRDAFFFEPYRRSREYVDAGQATELLSDGSNLAAVLQTTRTRYPARFRRIEDFVNAALPDIGALLNPFLEKQTYVSFEVARSSEELRLHEMGGGIEQLILVATALATAPESAAIFIDEPETHLHPGAQRVLAEGLRLASRQVFMATHSPVFIDTISSRIYRFELRDGTTKVERAPDADRLALVLEDIGVRNSDVLLADAVLFVEGESDRDTLRAAGERLGKPLDQRGVSTVVMHGGEFAHRYAPSSAAVLASISAATKIRHLFVLDRDERSDAQIDELKQSLGNTVVVLRVRELENLLLDPIAIRAALIDKAGQDKSQTAEFERLSPEVIAAEISEITDQLAGVVLLKRIRAELGSLRGGLLTREKATELATLDQASLPAAVVSAVGQQVSGVATTDRVTAVVVREIARFATDWSAVERRTALAPGADILERLYLRHGVRFDKMKDGPRIAKSLVGPSPELKALLDLIVGLAD